ncbi:hypothetical protein PCE1_003651 [Barthelona sp. PCE]
MIDVRRRFLTAYLCVFYAKSYAELAKLGISVIGWVFFLFVFLIALVLFALFKGTTAVYGIVLTIGAITIPISTYEWIYLIISAIIFSIASYIFYRVFSTPLEAMYREFNNELNEINDNPLYNCIAREYSLDRSLLTRIKTINTVFFLLPLSISGFIMKIKLKCDSLFNSFLWFSNCSAQSSVGLAILPAKFIFFYAFLSLRGYAFETILKTTDNSELHALCETKVSLHRFSVRKITVIGVLFAVILFILFLWESPIPFVLSQLFALALAVYVPLENVISADNSIWGHIQSMKNIVSAPLIFITLGALAISVSLVTVLYQPLLIIWHGSFYILLWVLARHHNWFELNSKSALQRFFGIKTELVNVPAAVCAMIILPIVTFVTSEAKTQLLSSIGCVVAIESLALFAHGNLPIQISNASHGQIITGETVHFHRIDLSNVGMGELSFSLSLDNSSCVAIEQDSVEIAYRIMEAERNGRISANLSEMNIIHRDLNPSFAAGFNIAHCLNEDELRSFLDGVNGVISCLFITENLTEEIFDILESEFGSLTIIQS